MFLMIKSPQNVMKGYLLLPFIKVSLYNFMPLLLFFICDTFSIDNVKKDWTLNLNHIISRGGLFFLNH